VLLARLETQLPEIFMSDYIKRLRAAHDRLRQRLDGEAWHPSAAVKESTADEQIKKGLRSELRNPSDLLKDESGWRDLNPRPLRPEMLLSFI
jgi:hypothetical protein